MSQVSTAQVAKTQTRAATRAANKASAAAPTLAFSIKQGFRPSAGAALFAHTEAFLTLSGAYEGATIPRAALAGVIGARAVQYHTEQGNMVATPMGVQLTEQGNVLFGSRKIDPEHYAEFVAILSTGKVGGYIKNQVGITAV